MDISRILALNIPDIHPAYGGVRGKTMSSRSQGYAWPVIKDAGVHTIIDLRNDGMNQRMQSLCEEHGMEYFYYPVDNRADVVENMVSLFTEFCERIDRGGFYIACVMGVHRTDIALSTFFFNQSANNSPVGAVLASSWFIFVPYNILIVYCKAKYLTVKIDVFILPYKK